MTAIKPSAPLNSPAFTGTPTAPTVRADDISNDIATTQFVANAVSPLQTQVFKLFREGTVSATANCADYPFVVPYDCTITGLRVTTKTAPSGAMHVQLRHASTPITTAPTYTDVTGGLVVFTASNVYAESADFSYNVVERDFLNFSLTTADAVNLMVEVLVTPTAQLPPGLVILDFDTGDLSQWRVVQAVDLTVSPLLDNTRTRHGTGYSAHFTVRPGDNPLPVGTTERCDLIGPSKFLEGDDVWIGWSTYLPDPGYNPTDTAGTTETNTFMDIHESKNSAGADPAQIPPITVSVNTNTFSYPYHLKCRVAGGPLASNGSTILPVQNFDLGTTLYNQWIDFIMHIVHSEDPAKGFFELYMNGSLVVGPLTCATKYPDQNNYLKLALYRTASMATSELWHDQCRVGLTKADVTP